MSWSNCPELAAVGDVFLVSTSCKRWCLKDAVWGRAWRCRVSGVRAPGPQIAFLVQELLLSDGACCFQCQLRLWAKLCVEAIVANHCHRELVSGCLCTCALVRVSTCTSVRARGCPDSEVCAHECVIVRAPALHARCICARACA